MNLSLAYSSWHTPATDYPRRQVGDFRIADYRYVKGYYNMSGLLDNALFRAAKPLTITDLQERRNGKWHTWMVDDPPHWEAMKFYASKAVGRVLTTGLGLGLVIHALDENKAVESIAVIERSQDVIDLVGDLVPLSVIIKDDFYDYMAATSDQYDTCIIDLWTASGVASKMKAYGEAIQTMFQVQHKWPGAKVFFHGFPSLCEEIWPMSESTKDALAMLAHDAKGGVR